eukprot:Skav220867  [mRNA]  locus=scaffold1331:32891:37425:+ [translate_table: standard]
MATGTWPHSQGVEDFLNLIKPWFSESTWQELQKKALSFVNTSLPNMVADIVSDLESLSFQALMFFVYLFFWIFEPLPISSPVAEVFKSYLLLKTLVCLLFATLMSVLLVGLQCKIWTLFFARSPAAHHGRVDEQLTNASWECLGWTMLHGLDLSAELYSRDRALAQRTARKRLPQVPLLRPF